MKPKLFSTLLIFIWIVSACTLPQKSEEQINDPLPSWNDTEVKSTIAGFINNVSNPASPDFVPVKDRIAVFDNDGTLWNEKPLYIPMEYEISYIQQAVKNRPEMLDNELYKGLAEGNLGVMKNYGTFDLIHLLFAAHDQQTENDYYQSVYTFLSEKQHPEFNRPFKEMTYQPMVELVEFLQANDFKVFIVTGGEITFVRTVSEEIYNIPSENVIGSNVQLTYVSDSLGQRLIRSGKVVSANDKHVKPANIGLHIGKKPIFAAGNSDGDYEMMEYTLSGEGPSMAILVHHDDDKREYSYTKGTEKAVKDASAKGWHIISMKQDFKEIFAE